MAFSYKLFPELRQAWDGAWYPLVAEEGEPSFVTHYGDSAKRIWEVCVSQRREAVILPKVEQVNTSKHAPARDDDNFQWLFTSWIESFVTRSTTWCLLPLHHRSYILTDVLPCCRAPAKPPTCWMFAL